MQNNSSRNHLPGQSDLFPAENMNSRIKSHLKRDRYGSNVNGFPVPTNNEVQGNNGKRFCIQDETTDTNFSQLNQANQEMNQSHEQDMEIGYEESPPPPTYEGLEERFKDEIMKLARERSDAEDAEFVRHKERILEINAEYQEMLSALRAQQATRREEFLCQELQVRLNQYHEDKRNQCPNMSVPDVHGYTGPLTAGEAIGRSHGDAEYKHDGELALPLPSWRSEGSEATTSFIAREAIGSLPGTTEYNHDGERALPFPSWRREGNEARPSFTAGESTGTLHGATEYNHDGERIPLILSARSEGSEARVPLPPGRVYNNRAVYH